MATTKQRATARRNPTKARGRSIAGSDEEQGMMAGGGRSSARSSDRTPKQRAAARRNLTKARAVRSSRARSSRTSSR